MPHFLACGIMTFAQAQKYLATISALTKDVSLDSSKKRIICHIPTL
ncbi:MULTISPECIES: hypothetical protein [Okeania]|nr:MULTISPECIES: hypothetical protein [Okeania]